MTPYNVMTNLEMSGNGRYVVSDDCSGFCSIYTFNVYKTALIFNKGVLCGEVTYEEYPNVFMFAIRPAQAAELMIGMITYAITHPVEAVIAFSATPIIGSRTDILYRILCIFETAGIRVIPHKYLNIHNIRCGINAYFINAGYETDQLSGYQNIVDVMGKMTIKINDNTKNKFVNKYVDVQSTAGVVIDSIPALNTKLREINKRGLVKGEYIPDIGFKNSGRGKTVYASYIDEFFKPTIYEKIEEDDDD